LHLLEPDDPLLSFPNRLDTNDFAGWVHERGLYFLRTWPEAMRPLLECADAGEPPQRGGLLHARLGKGHSVYCAYTLLGVIMGANIGTTVTAWIIALVGFKVNMGAMAVPLVGVGFLLSLSKTRPRKHCGYFIIGFALLFIGLEFLKDALPDLRNNPTTLAFLAALRHAASGLPSGGQGLSGGGAGHKRAFGVSIPWA
jgi:hypothetical protein